MIILDVKQNSPEWLMARLGIPTASEFDALISPLGKIRTGEGVETYLCTKLAEKWRGEPLQSFGGGAAEQGSIREGEARPWYEFEYEVEVKAVGFVTSDDGRIGCSPDGLIGDDCGWECKCPLPQTHVGYLRAGTLPKAYVAQVQGSMLVTGFAQWKFLSYCRGLPPLLLTVLRDDEFIESLREALGDFNAKMDSGWATLVELNGGEPTRRQVEEFAVPFF